MSNTSTEKQALWDERISAYRQSRQSVAAWCRENDVPAKQMYYQLSKARKAQAPPATSSLQWIDLTNGEAIGNTSTGISMRIGTVVLEVQRGFNQDVLADVVRTLIELC
jgi:hypothetical protein